MGLLIPAFNSFLNNKKLKIYIISMSVTFGMIISIIYSLYAINNTFSEKIQNNIINRVIYSNCNEEKNNLNDFEIIENVEYVYRRLVPFSMNVNELFRMNTMYVSKEEIPLIIKGENFKNNEDFEIILPKKILDRTNKWIFLDNFIGERISLTIEDLNIEALVVGIYEVNNYESNMYINEKLKNKLIEYNNVIEDNNSVYLVANNYSNVEEIIENLKSNGLIANLNDLSGQTDIKIYNLAKNLILIILFLTIIYTYISISIIIANFLNNERIDIAIFKAMGYKIRDISSIFRYRISTILAISFFIGSIISVFLIKIIECIIEYKLSISIFKDIKSYLIVLFLMFVCVYTISIIAIKFNNIRLKKVNIIELLKDE